MKTGSGRGKNCGWWGGEGALIREIGEKVCGRVHVEGTAQEKHFPKTTEGKKTSFLEAVELKV